MALDNKYGRVTLEHGTIGEDEPIFVLRARDARSLDALAGYVGACLAAGSPRQHIDLILDSYTQIANWQDEHLDEVKIPESQSTVERRG